jgi:hypothetical protein
VVLGSLALFLLIGVATIVLVPESQRSLLIPAAPVIGAAVLVVCLHLTGLLLPVRLGIWLVVALCLTSLVVAGFRGSLRSLLRLRPIIQLALMSLVGALGAVLALIPSLTARTALAVQPSASNDAFYYIGVADWFRDNPITRSPVIGQSPSTGTDSPAFGPAAETLRLGLRFGQELVNAGISELLGRDPVSTLSPLLAVYVLILPGGVWVLGAAFRMSTAVRVLLAAALVTTFTMINQVQNQNADSILGTAMVPLVLGLCSVALFRRDDDKEPPLVPKWLAALSLSALVGTYTEYLVFVVAVLACLVLIGPRADFKVRLLRALSISGLALLIGPVIWFRAVQGLVLAAGLSLQETAASDLTTVVGLIVGPYDTLASGQPQDRIGHVTTLGLQVAALLVAIGLVIGLVTIRSRALTIGVLVAAAGAVYIGLRGNAYITGRAADMITPLVVIAAVVGWSVAIESISRRRSVPVRYAGLGIAAAASVSVIAVAAVSIVQFTDTYASDDRVVSADYAQAASWIDRIEQDDGSNVTVATASIEQQLWITDALRELPDVSYVNLRGDLGYRSDLSMTSFWDGEVDRYLLVGPGAFVAQGATVIESNTTFSLVDLDAPATVVVPVVPSGGPQTWFYTAQQSGPITSAGQGPAAMELITSEPTVATLSLELVGLADGSQVVLTQDGEELDRQETVAGQAELSLAGVDVASRSATVSVHVVGDPSATFALIGLSG